MSQLQHHEEHTGRNAGEVRELIPEPRADLGERLDKALTADQKERERRRAKWEWIRWFIDIPLHAAFFASELLAVILGITITAVSFASWVVGILGDQVDARDWSNMAFDCIEPFWLSLGVFLATTLVGLLIGKLGKAYEIRVGIDIPESKAKSDRC